MHSFLLSTSSKRTDLQLNDLEGFYSYFYLENASEWHNFWLSNAGCTLSFSSLRKIIRRAIRCFGTGNPQFPCFVRYRSGQGFPNVISLRNTSVMFSLSGCSVTLWEVFYPLTHSEIFYFILKVMIILLWCKEHLGTGRASSFLTPCAWQRWDILCLMSRRYIIQGLKIIKYFVYSYLYYIIV